MYNRMNYCSGLLVLLLGLFEKCVWGGHGIYCSIPISHCFGWGLFSKSLSPHNSRLCIGRRRKLLLQEKSSQVRRKKDLHLGYKAGNCVTAANQLRKSLKAFLQFFYNYFYNYEFMAKLLSLYPPYTSILIGIRILFLNMRVYISLRKSNYVKNMIATIHHKKEQLYFNIVNHQVTVQISPVFCFFFSLLY